MQALADNLWYKLDQGHLIDQMCVFIKLTHGDYPFPKFNKKALRGLCFGFSVSYAAMCAVNKERWWLSLLQVCSNWDRNPESLEQIYLLPRAKETQTLKQLFTRLCHYVIFHQTTLSQSPLLIEQGFIKVDQLNIVSKHFELLDNRGNILVPCMSKEYVTYHFIQLYNLLTKIAQQYKICCGESKVMILLKNRNHGCALDIRKDKYIFYNPNCIKGPKTHISITSLCCNIIKTLGNFVNVTIIELQKKPETTSKQPPLIASPPVVCVAENDFLPAVLENDIYLQEQLAYLSFTSIEGKKMTVLHHRDLYMDQVFMEQLFQYAIHSSIVRRGLAKALRQTDNYGVSGFYSLCFHGNLQHIRTLFILAETDLYLRQAIANTINLPDYKGKTPLLCLIGRVFDQNAYDVLQRLFRLAVIDSKTNRKKTLLTPLGDALFADNEHRPKAYEILIESTNVELREATKKIIALYKQKCFIWGFMRRDEFPPTLF